MKLRLLVFPLFLLLCGGVSESAKILGIFPNAGYSQYILGSSLMKQLADKGHQVTIISPFSLKNKVENIKEICTTNLSEPSYGK